MLSVRVALRSPAAVRPSASPVLAAAQHVRLASSTPSYKLAIVGGGTAGITVAATFAGLLGRGQVVVIEPSETHYYQPLWTLVGGGLKSFDESKRPTASVMPRNADWIRGRVATFEPESNQLTLENGEKVNYEYLVVAAGIQVNWDKIKGLKESLGKNGVTSNYHPESVTKTAEFIRDFKGGKAVFTQPSTPIKCAGAPQKIMYLAEESFRLAGIRKQSEVSFHSGMGKIFSVDKYGKALTKICEKRQMSVNLLSDLVEIQPDNKVALFKKLGPNNAQDDLVSVSYDLLHVTPPMGPPNFIKASPLADANGWVSVNKQTTRHTKYPNVFSIGDASSLPTSKTAAAVAAQSLVLKENLKAAMDGKTLPAVYDGYTSCPLVTGRNKLIMAEFNYDLQPQETFPFDQSEENQYMYRIKADLLPQVYWTMMLRGMWSGPAWLRRSLSVLKSSSPAS